jgi:hypothetical protein
MEITDTQRSRVIACHAMMGCIDVGRVTWSILPSNIPNWLRYYIFPMIVALVNDGSGQDLEKDTHQ